MSLSSLVISRNRVSDLSPLAGMPLTLLDLRYNQVSDLSPLAGMRLTRFVGFYNAFSDLSPLRGMPISHFNCASTTVTDLSALVDMPLAWLDVNSTPLADISLLSGKPLGFIDCSQTLISDFQPLLGMPLSDLRLQLLLFHPPEEALVRSLPTKSLGSRYNDVYPAEEFWKRIYERRASAEKFVTEVSRLPPQEQSLRIESMLRELNGTHDIELSVTISGEGIDTAKVRMPSRVGDITPLRALTELKRMTIGGGHGSLDLSPLNSLPIEELICLRDQARRNCLMLAEIETLKSINGQPVQPYLESLRKPQEASGPVPPLTEPELRSARPSPEERSAGLVGLGGLSNLDSPPAVTTSQPAGLYIDSAMLAFAAGAARLTAGSNGKAPNRSAR
jgi:hypothetical protein